MSTPIITVDGLGKAYRLGLKEERYPTFRDALVGAAAAPWRRFRRLSDRRSSDEELFWALKDVSFEVNRGEVVGIIGRNGAGKSTLLKILSRIVEPTAGRAILRGRVASLLEVGTGFHPELTGRENIYLNGSILGMKKREIDRKFDEIVAFAEVEKFLDTPVKRYSSGMYVRLAFAVAAHLEPEILIVDEVLAVGDAEFQKKCLGKMQEVARGGERTVLFVSHNLAAVERLCTRGILLSAGTGQHTENIGVVLKRYMQSSGQIKSTATWSHLKHLRSASVTSGSQAPDGTVTLGDSLRIVATLETAEPIRNLQLGIGIDAYGGHRLLTMFTPPELKRDQLVGRFNIECEIPFLPLAPGDYSVKLALGQGAHSIDEVDPAIEFRVLDGDPFGHGRSHHRGVCIAHSNWRAELLRTAAAIN
jgi:lipopolysaccharide transport system ATP-binding protein